MRIHVFKDGQQFGPYGIDEVKAHLAAGHFAETDYGMAEGAAEWQTLADVLAASTPATPSPTSSAVPVISVAPQKPAASASESEADDDVDYDKLKQWEDQFEDEEEPEPETSAHTAQSSPVPPAQPLAPATPTPPPVQSEPPDSPVPPVAPAEPVPPLAAPPPATAAPVPSPEAPPPAESVPLEEPASAPSSFEKPRPKKKRRGAPDPEEDYYDDDFEEDEPLPRRRRRRSGRNRKIQGLNQGQTVIVVKGGGIGSKILTGLLVLLVLALILWLVGLMFTKLAPKSFPDELKVLYPWESAEAPASEEPDETPEAAANTASPAIQSLAVGSLSLNEDQVQSLRSSGVYLYKDSEGDGLRCVAPSEPGLELVDEDLPALTALAVRLTWLDLSKCSLTDEGVEQLASMTNLRRLSLEENKDLTSAGLAKLKDLQKLEHLNLVGTGLDDTAVETLTALAALREVYLTRTGFTDAGVERLRAEHPNKELLVNIG